MNHLKVYCNTDSASSKLFLAIYQNNPIVQLRHNRFDRSIITRFRVVVNTFCSGQKNLPLRKVSPETTKGTLKVPLEIKGLKLLSKGRRISYR